MNGKLVDTNVIIRFLKGQTELFSLFDDMENLYVSSISVGELMYGAELSQKKDYNSSGYYSFCEQMKVLNIDMEIARNLKVVPFRRTISVLLQRHLLQILHL